MIKNFFSQYYDYILLVLIVLATVLLGSRMIFAGNFFFLADQGRDFLLVKDIVINHKLALIGTHSGLGGFFHGPLWLYLLIPIFLVGHGNPMAFAYFYIVLAAVTVIAGFFIGKNLYGKIFGLLFAFILATSPTVWGAIPNTIGVNAMPLVYLCLFFFLVRYLRGNVFSFWGAAFFTGLAFQFETASAIVLVPVVAIVFFLEKKGFTNLKVIAGSVVAFVISLTTFILFDVRHQFLMTKSLLGFFHSNTTHVKGYLSLGERVVAHWQSLLNVLQAAFFTHSSVLVLLTCTMLGTFAYLWRTGKLSSQTIREFWVFALFPVVTYVFYLAYPYTIWPEYVFGLTIPIAFALALLMQMIYKSKLGILLVGLFLFLSWASVVSAIKQSYSGPYPQNTTAGAYLVQKHVAQWVFADAKKQQFGYFVYTPETFTYGMDYLFWWMGKEYGYIPESKKLAITYLVMYPPLSGDASAHEFWKKNVIHTQASVVLRKVFPGNIIVEKLVIPGNDPEVDPNYYQNLIFR